MLFFRWNGLEMVEICLLFTICPCYLKRFSSKFTLHTFYRFKISLPALENSNLKHAAVSTTHPNLLTFEFSKTVTPSQKFYFIYRKKAIRNRVKRKLLYFSLNILFGK